MPEIILAFLSFVGAVTIVVILLAMIWLGLAEDRMDEHWPRGLDETPILDVQNHVGDSRPIR